MKRIILYTLALIVIGCSIPENLGIPSWETNLKFYLINSTYQAVDLAEADSSFAVSGDTLMIYQEMNETQVLEFSSDPEAQLEEESIGDLEIDNPDPVFTEVLLSDLAPGLVSGSVPAPGIAPFIFPEIIKDDIEPFNQFEEVICTSGILRFSVLNNTAIWIGDITNGNPFEIILMDVNGNEIAGTQFEDIPPLATEIISSNINLNGETLYNEFQIKLLGGSSGTNGQAADIDISASLDITIELIDLVVNNAFARIPAQDVEETVVVAMDDQVIIYNAVIADGDYEIVMNFSNRIDLDIQMTISCDKLQLTGETNLFSREITIPRSGGNGNVTTYQEIIDLSGAIIGDGSNLDSLFVSVIGFTNDTGDDYREVDSEDYFSSEVIVSSLDFASITGILMPKDQDPIESEQILDIAYPYIDGEFALVGHSEIRIELDTPVYTEMSLQIEAKNSADNEIVNLVNLTTGLTPELSVTAGHSVIIYDSEHYNINEMISILPDLITYTMQPVVGNVNEIFTYHEGEEIKADIFIECELDIAADCIFVPKNDAGEPNVQMVNTETITQDELDAYVSGTLILNYVNQFGLSAGVDLLISEQKITDFDQVINSDSTLFTIIEVPLIEETDDVEQTISIDLKKSDLEVMLADSVFVIPKLKISSEAGTPVSGAIEFRGMVDLILKVSQDLVED